MTYSSRLVCLAAGNSEVVVCAKAQGCEQRLTRAIMLMKNGQALLHDLLGFMSLPRTPVTFLLGKLSTDHDGAIAPFGTWAILFGTPADGVIE